MPLHDLSATPRALLLAALAFTLPTLADASQCSVGFDAELEIDARRIVVDDTELGEVVFGEGGALAIDGRAVSLDAEQRAAVDAYATQLREVVPEVVELAIDGVEIAVTTVSEVFSALVGAEAPESVREAMAELRADAEAGLGRDEGVWYVRRDGIENLDETMGRMEPLIESAIAESVGAMLMAVGRSMRSGGDDDEGGLASFTERMANFERDIETQVEARAEAIEERAEGLCDEMRTLAEREREMQTSIPALDGLSIITRS